MKAVWILLALTVTSLFAGGAIEGEVQKQDLNISAIVMFLFSLQEHLESLIGQQNVQKRRRIFIRQAEVLPDFKTVWQLRVTLCRRHRF